MRRLALSLKQPWAALLVAGRKSIEVRRWTTAYRGELLIHAARVDDPRPAAWAHVDDAVRPLTRLRGGIVGAGLLADVRRYRSREVFRGDRGLHLNEEDWYEERGLYGFRFDQLRAVPFHPVAGYVRLFEVDFQGPEPPAAPPPDGGCCPADPLAAILRRFRRLAGALTRRPAEGE